MFRQDSWCNEVPRISSPERFSFFFEHISDEKALRASPTVLQISFAFMYLQKSLKNTYSTVWYLDFAILLTLQKERKDWHICQTCSHLALENWREVINAKPLEIASFHLCHIFLRLGKLSHLPNQLCKTVGDALKDISTFFSSF